MTLRTPLLAACLSAGLVLAVQGAGAQTFDGITIVDLDDPAGKKAIAGNPGDSPRSRVTDAGRYIVTFVSAAGTYAALTGRQNDRMCVAWAVPGSYSGSAISFGLPASTATIRGVNPRVCEPFTVTFIDGATVRVDAGSYRRNRPVVARVPLAALDWGDTAFDKHTVLDARLGPVSNAIAGIDGGASVRIVGGQELRRSPLGAAKSVEWRVSGHPRRANHTIYGTIADRTVLGWPWDVLYAARAREQLPQAAIAQAFEDAVIGRFGPPSFIVAGIGRDLTRYWTYDLGGRQLGPEAAPGDSCHATIDDWIGKELHTYAADLGPWGCLVVARLTNRVDLDPDHVPAKEVDGRMSDYAVVGQTRDYRQEVVSGYALALNHFLGLRLFEVREMQAQLADTASIEPRL